MMVMKWIRRQFRDVEHARKAVLTTASILGILGFLICVGAWLAHWIVST